MKRKVFLKSTAQASLATLLIGDALRGCGSGNSSQQQSGPQRRVLVLIQLDGGNDGLNTVIPIDQYANLTRARKNIIIPEKEILALNNTSVTGLHPALGGLQRLYNNKQLTIVQGVGHTYPNLSHFKAFEIWNTCYDEAASAVQTGWLGRFLDKDHPKNPNADPTAIQTSAGLSQALQGRAANAGVAVQTDSAFYNLQPGHYDTAPSAAISKPLSFIRTMVSESKEYLLKVKAATDAQKSLSPLYPPSGSNTLADQLKIIAQLIGGGLHTQVYIASLGGFDTHVSQTDTSDPTKGDHASLLAKVSVAIEAFQDDLNRMGKQDEVMGMVYSEFGRRIISNASFGCDHGTSAPVLFFGSKLKGGIVGDNPEIAAKVGSEDNLKLQTDFRSVYASVLKGWFGAPDDDVNTTVLGKFPTLDIFKA